MSSFLKSGGPSEREREDQYRAPWRPGHGLLSESRGTWETESGGGARLAVVRSLPVHVRGSGELSNIDSSLFRFYFEQGISSLPFLPISSMQ